MADPNVVVIGGGIVGLAIAARLTRDHPDLAVTVVEKETEVGYHQTGHNSGVVHAGLYYPPGSLKARLCLDGRAELREYCDEHDIGYRELGKLVVATEESELPRFEELFARARHNVADLARLSGDQIKEVEPLATGLAAIHSPRTALIDFRAVARRLAADVIERGHTVLLGSRVVGLRQRGSKTAVELAGGAVMRADRVVVAAGLHSDTVARMIHSTYDLRIVPFKGKYYALRAGEPPMVNGLIYPVPNPDYPFLGVHITRHHDDSVTVGPNAYLALRRESYGGSPVRVREAAHAVLWPGFALFARKNWRVGAREVAGALSRRAQARAARRFIPEIRASDMTPSAPGVRAQAMRPDGSLVDDFDIRTEDGVMVIGNAPSPAATSALAIAAHVVREHQSFFTGLNKELRPR